MHETDKEKVYDDKLSDAEQVLNTSRDEIDPANPVISNVVQALEIVRNAANLD